VLKPSAVLSVMVMGCGGVSDQHTGQTLVDQVRMIPEVTPPEPTIRRLNRDQYDNAIRELLGPDLVLPSHLEPDEATDGLRAIGASLTTISPRGVEQYEKAAHDLVAQAFEDDERRNTLVPCETEEMSESACAKLAIEPFATRAWRRPLKSEEVDSLVRIAMTSSSVLNSFHLGIQYAFTAVIQSPHFVFRVELGEPDPKGDGRRFTNYEMASRMSFLLWNTIPDQDLLDSAEAGELTTDSGLEHQVDRMMADERFEDGIRAIFTDIWTLYQLDDLTKDPAIFTHMSPDVGASAREETLLNVIDNVIDQDADFRELFTSTRTFLDRKLASIYSVRAPAREGFGETVLSDEGGRRGFLGQVSFLALQSHAVNSSATLRGKFVREVLLCQYIPPPPSDVDTSIPEASGDAVTLRDRVAIHLEDPNCSSCHELVDPIGLGFEQFDGLGHFRSLEQGATIDPSGDLDGTSFANAWELAGAVAAHDRLSVCMAQTMLAYASGHSVTEGEDAAVEYLNQGFESMDYSIQFLLKDMILSPAFRQAGEIE
jgi:hypothetical protein